MDAIRILTSRCAALFRRRKLDEELDEEVGSHIEFAIEENLKRGMTEQEARTAALQTFGGITQVKEAYRVRRGVPLLEHLTRDLRFSIRQLRRSPGFSLTAILTLALGIGAVTSVFSVVNSVLLKPFAFPDPGQLVVLRETVQEMAKVAPTLPDNPRHYVNLKTQSKTLQDAAIFQPH